MKPLVSIVTPVYNGASHLAECIESVLRQTYENWEYIIVNNCSEDDSLRIACSYASKHTKIRVVNNGQFLDAIPNHNHALRQISAASKYCKMVFADDWLYPECIEKMVDLAEQDATVGIVGAFGLRGVAVAWGGLPYGHPVTSGREFCRAKLLGCPLQFGPATAVLFRADLVRERKEFFNARNIHADTEIFFDLLSSCNFGFIYQILSFTRVDEHSRNAFSRRYNTRLAGLLLILVQYGRQYLTKTELEKALSDHLSEYYAFLAYSVVPLKSRDFWAFHKHELEAAGIPLSRWRLALAFAWRILHMLLNPGQSVSNFIGRRRPHQAIPSVGTAPDRILHVAAETRGQ